MIKIGPFSRGGYSRQGSKGSDHDFEPEATLKLFGIHVPEKDENFVYFTESNVTADFIGLTMQYGHYSFVIQFCHAINLIAPTPYSATE